MNTPTRIIECNSNVDGTPGGSRVALAANAARNEATDGHRRRRWRPARDALWALLDRHIAPGARVAVVGAGNGDDLPLLRLGRRTKDVDLIDLDGRALRRARRRGRLTTPRAGTITTDVTAGAADAIIAQATGDTTRSVQLPLPVSPIGDGPYDVILADLLYTQLLYPALADTGLPGSKVDATLLDHGQPLTDAVVRRLHAAAPDGTVIHVHDVLGWWARHPQPFELDAVIALAETDPAAALTLTAHGSVPYGCDPRAASVKLGAQIIDTAFWHWPFAPATDYLVCATVARTAEVNRRSLSSPPR